MYGNLKPGGRDPVALRVDSYLGSLDKPVPVAPTPIAWELVLLLAAEFLSFAVVLTPLIVDNASDREIETFWRTYSLLALAACGPYILLTTPVAAGYSWFVQRWPLNLVTWLFIILSLACVVHIASVPTDPRGVFIGCCSITSYLLLLVVVVYFEKFPSFVDFFFAIFWHLIAFLPAYLAGAITGGSALGGWAASALCCVYFGAELRLVRSGAVIGLSSAHSLRDPFTVGVWINCATWRFLVQLLILSQKFFFQSLSLLGAGIVKGWRKVVSAIVRLTPAQWFTPVTVPRKLATLTHSV